MKPVPPAISQPTIAETIDFLRETYGDVLDKSSKAPIWMHPVEVMSRLDPNAPIEVKLAALLHDIVEDTKDWPNAAYPEGKPIPFSLLRDRGYSERVVTLVSLVTKISGQGVYEDGMEYPEWVHAIIAAKDPDAIRIKFADVSENASPERLEDMPEIPRQKAEAKYPEPLLDLKHAMVEHQLMRPLKEQGVAGMGDLRATFGKH